MQVRYMVSAAQHRETIVRQRPFGLTAVLLLETIDHSPCSDRLYLEPPVVVTPLLIVWVRLASDAGTLEFD